MSVSPYIKPELHKNMSRTHLRAGDVLLNITGASIGRSTFVPDELGPANVNQHVCIIRTGPWINPKYLSNWLNSPLAQNMIFATETGVTRQGLNFSQIKSLPIPYPRIENQNKLVERIDNLFATYKSIRQYIEKANEKISQIDETIITEGFRGKFVPQNPDDESATVLLKRIESQLVKQATNNTPRKSAQYSRQLTLN
jgi:type I restriction enzyme, S subunit